MKRLMLIGFAAGAFVALPILPVVAMPSVATAPSLTSPADQDVVLVKLGGRGHHYGWTRSRGRHLGFIRGRHRGWL
jgi:hypothetical protein